MIGKLKKAVQLIENMGWRYIIFRSGFELKKRTGILKSKFPIQPSVDLHYTLESWKKIKPAFFFESKEKLNIDVNLSPSLQEEYKDLAEYKYTFFSRMKFNLGLHYDWKTNPTTHYQYNANLHWLDINDFDPKVGDIKFVWEPSRFSHIYTLIRYDKQSGEDCSARVFSEIERWMDANPINQGPNFKCSQEISLRVMNWTFALYYYQNSPHLTETLFTRIQHFIYWQVEHVYHNINFSRIAVRNNHAITETLLLYLAGLLYPNFPNAKKWKANGKRWFEQEIAYQVYEDGTFLQFSMNYHRVVVQLLTWAINLSAANHEKFSPVVYARAKSSLLFLMNAMDKESGWLPNYGANDGALFFKLNDNHYRDYRPQLEALSIALGLKWPYDKFEDARWYAKESDTENEEVLITDGMSSFKNGGYYTYRTPDTFNFLRCGNHKDRPSQADNLHFDLWYKGLNLLHDAGSYKYNTEPEILKYFMGSGSHNTVMLNDYDQMNKGARFIWFNWTQCEAVSVSETTDVYSFQGTIKTFLYLDKKIRHERKLTFYKALNKWEIEDTIINKPKEMYLKQLWHTCFPEMLNFTTEDNDRRELKPSINEGYQSIFYGEKTPCTQITFSSLTNTIKTTITINEIK